MRRLPLVLIVLWLAACGSDEPSKKANEGTAPGTGTTVAPSTRTTPPTTPTPARKGGCVNLGATPAVKSTLLAVHRRFDPTATGPRPGSTYYGRCGSSYYALASFRHANTGYDDQPEAFKRVSAWRDLGDTGGPIEDNCGRVPRPLMAAWGFNCAG